MSSPCRPVPCQSKRCIIVDFHPWPPPSTRRSGSSCCCTSSGRRGAFQNGQGHLSFSVPGLTHELLLLVPRALVGIFFHLASAQTLVCRPRIFIAVHDTAIGAHASCRASPPLLCRPRTGQGIAPFQGGILVLPLLLSVISPRRRCKNVGHCHRLARCRLLCGCRLSLRLCLYCDCDCDCCSRCRCRCGCF